MLPKEVVSSESLFGLPFPTLILISGLSRSVNVGVGVSCDHLIQLHKPLPLCVALPVPLI
jgi:hypothetical protein